jgi:subtilisin family serine protease
MGTTVRDEVIVVLGTPDRPGGRAAAATVAASVGARMVGGVDALGVYQIRWDRSPDLAAMSSRLRATSGVNSVGPSVWGGAAMLALRPSDWNDDGPEATFHFELVRAPEVWAPNIGASVKVGVVEAATAFAGHEDLRVRIVGGSQPNDLNATSHATHVAGLACGLQNGRGLVGAAWGCEIVAAGAGTSFLTLLQRAKEVVDLGARVVNMSFGYSIGPRCATAQEARTLAAMSQQGSAVWKQLFEGYGRDVIWTVAAGNNCSGDSLSPMMAADAQAGIRAADNVLTVASVNSDAKLSSFSGWGLMVDVAAPGGVYVYPNGTTSGGVWSATPARCGFQGLSMCSSYGASAGTSMSAPIVAGLAAIVREGAPRLSAPAASACIRSSGAVAPGAGRASERSLLPKSTVIPGGFDNPPTAVQLFYGIPIVDFPVSLECARFQQQIGEQAENITMQLVESPRVIGVEPSGARRVQALIRLVTPAFPGPQDYGTTFMIEAYRNDGIQFGVPGVTTASTRISGSANDGVYRVETLFNPGTLETGTFSIRQITVIHHGLSTSRPARANELGSFSI